MSTADVCRQIESYCCSIDGVAYTFEVHSAAILPGSPGRAILQVGAMRRTAAGRALAARMRVTAALPDLDRVPGLLNDALQQWLSATADGAVTVH